MLIINFIYLVIELVIIIMVIMFLGKVLGVCGVGVGGGIFGNVLS